MSSISIEAARATYGGEREWDVIQNMANATGVRRIYRYRNAYQPWWRRGATDYFRIERPGDEERLRASGEVRRLVLVYDQYRVVLPVPWSDVGLAVGLMVSAALTYVAATGWEWGTGQNPIMAATGATFGIQTALALVASGPAWLVGKYAFDSRPGAGMLAYAAIAVLTGLVLILW